MMDLADWLTRCRDDIASSFVKLARTSTDGIALEHEAPAILGALTAELRDADSSHPRFSPLSHAALPAELDLELVMRDFAHLQDVVLAKAIEAGASADDLRRVAQWFAGAMARASKDAAARSADRLRRVVEASGAGTWEIDLVTRKTAGDVQHQELVASVDAGDDLMRRLDAFVHLDDRARVIDALNAAAAGENGGVVWCELRAIDRAAMSVRWLELRGRAVRDASGRATRIVGTSVDVTARKKTEIEREALFQSEHRARTEAEQERRKLHDIFMQAPAAICILEGPQHTYTFANPAYRALVGGRDVVGKTLHDALPDVRSNGFDTIMDRVIATGEPFFGNEVTVKLEHHRPDEVLIVNFVYHPKRNLRGEVDGIIAVVSDVTEQVSSRRRAETLAANLQASETRLRQVLEAAGAGCWDLDAATGDIAGDPQMLVLMGLPPDKPFTLDSGLSRLPPEDRDRVEAAVRAALSGENGGRYNMEFRTRLPNDEGVRWVESRANLLFDAQGRATHLAGVMMDVSARKDAELAQTTLLESIADQSVFGVAVMVGHELRFELANAGYRAMIGNRQALGRPLLEVLPELAGQGADTTLREIMRTHRARTFREHRYLVDVHGNGKPVPRYYDAIWQPLRSPGARTDGVLVIVHDVTESVLAREREQGLRTQAEEANRLKDDFLATVSHELRTPLHAMLGWVQMLRSQRVTPERAARGLETIERSARAQRQLIEDLLDIARITSGKLKIEPELMPMASAVEAAIESIRPAAEARAITLHVSLDPTATVRGDGARLQQVAWNLLANAVKFTPRHGRVDVSLRARDAFVELVVSDTGSGISPEFLRHVFDRFRQAEGATTREHGGLGLGLSIVKYLVELHGGIISAESPGLGHGATFRVRLPSSADDSRAPSTTRRGLPEFHCPPEIDGLRILVVDDEPDARDLLQSILEGCGAVVDVAASAKEGFTKLEQFSPDLLLSDIGMPFDDGYALIRKVRALPASQGGRVVAVALTAFARAEDRTRALRAGFNAHVPKPIEPVELVAVLAAVAPLRNELRP